MQNRLYKCITIIISFCLFIGLATPVMGQTGWLNPISGNGISFEAHKASFSHIENLSFLTSNLFLEGKFKLSDEASFVVEIAYSHLDTKYDFEAENLFGNPYLGIEFADKLEGSIFNIGIRPPIASDSKYNASFIGAFTTVHRAEAFIPDVLTLYASGGQRYISQHNVTTKYLIGPTLFIPTEEGIDPELQIDYQTEWWIKSEQFNFGVGLSGRFWISEPLLTFGERMTNQLGLIGNIAFNQSQIGLHLRIPIDEDWRQIVSIVYGIHYSTNL